MGRRRWNALLVTVPGDHQERDLILMRGAPIESLQRVPLFADLGTRDLKRIARLFKVRHFSSGETVIKEGSGGSAFFVIESGEATVFVNGRKRATLKPGDYFGEVALI